MTEHSSEPAGRPGVGLRLDEPIVVLTGSRHGSTLLRLMLDAHPSLACPAETNILRTCSRLARVAKLLSSDTDRNSGADRAVVRATVDLLFGDYLRGAGKQRWCDKSIDATGYADDFLQAYPRTRFVCLYRHCLDVIDSGIEITPWGLSSFGFRPYAQRYPGNDVAAIADYWITTTRQRLEFERSHPEVCQRVCYEDLVGAPEEVAAEVFSFLGEAVVPGITTNCFANEGGSTGPGDPKIWATSTVSTKSVGRGVRVPIDRIPDTIQASVAELLEELGYPKLGERYDRIGRPQGQTWDDPEEARLAGEVDRQVGQQVRESLGVMPMLTAEWRAALGDKPVAIVASPWPEVASHWRVDVVGASCIRSSGDPFDGAAWVLLAEPEALLDVLAGRLNLASAMRRGLARIESTQPGADRAARDGLMPPPAARREDVVRLQVTARLLGTATVEPDESSDL